MGESSKRYAIVVARYQEDIRWMSYLGRRPGWDIFLYNDGPPLDYYFSPNFRVLQGDGVPSEGCKYLQFICDNYNTLNQYDWIVFMQGDPFRHSPDFIGLLESSEYWRAPFQSLTHGPFPRYWRDLNTDSSEKTTPTTLGNYRYFLEDLNDDWTGGESDLRASCMIGAASVSQFFSYYGAKLGSMKRCFSACFATTPTAIHGQTYETWNKLRGSAQQKFLVTDAPCVWRGWLDEPNSFTLTKQDIKAGKRYNRKIHIGKAFGYFLEFVWYPLLVGEEPEGRVQEETVAQEVAQEETVAQEVVQKDVIQESLYLKPLNEYEKVLVVSRYNEIIHWIHKVANNFDFIMVFNKGNPITLNLSNSVVIPCHNVGREGETYLRYIKQYFDELPTYTVFTQGDPFTHNPNMIQTLKDIELTGKFNALSSGWKFGYPKEYTMENNQCRTYLMDTRTFQVNNFYDDGVERFVKLALKDAGLKKSSDLMCNVCKQVGLVIPPRHIYFVYSALFAVHKDAIKSNDISVYENLYRYLHSKNLQGGAQGYILERLWYYIFTHQN